MGIGVFMEGLELKMVEGPEGLSEAAGIREAVFIAEQGVAREEEMDGLDGEATHVIACLGGRAVGCGRIRFIGKKAKLERIAVLKDHRGRGIGRAITSFMVEQARRSGTREAVMHAQCHTAGFYAALGFRARGEEFMEAGIRHVEMYMEL